MSPISTPTREKPWPNQHPFTGHTPNYNRHPYPFPPPFNDGVFHTPLGERLATYNPTLYKAVYQALKKFDEKRESRYREVLEL